MKKRNIFFFLALLCLFGKDLYGQKVAGHLSPPQPGASAPGLPFDLSAGVSGGIPVKAYGDTIRELKVGDRVPDIEFYNTLNNNGKPIRISDYKGKLLILDFWATWCAPCIKGFPKLDSLDKAFGDQVAILPVTYQPSGEITGLFSSRKKLADIKMPMIFSDDVMRHLFPHRTLPHYVWIDPDGSVMAFTDGKEIDFLNIENAISDTSHKIEPKDNYFQKHDKAEYLVSGNTHMAEKKVLMQSAFMGKINGLPSGYNVFSKVPEEPFRFVATNSILSTFYKVAFGEGNRYFTEPQIILEVEHPEKFYPKYSDMDMAEWMDAGNVYCYELIVPVTQREHAYRYLKEDLKRMFPEYSAEVELREREVLMIIRKREYPGLRTKGGAPYANVHFRGASIKNLGLEVLAFHLGIKYLQHHGLPVVDATGISHKVDLQIEAEMDSLNDIDRALGEFGLGIAKGSQIIEVLVIKDTLSNNQSYL